MAYMLTRELKSGMWILGWWFLRKIRCHVLQPTGFLQKFEVFDNFQPSNTSRHIFCDGQNIIKKFVPFFSFSQRFHGCLERSDTDDSILTESSFRRLSVIKFVTVIPWNHFGRASRKSCIIGYSVWVFFWTKSLSFASISIVLIISILIISISF